MPRVSQLWIGLLLSTASICPADDWPQWRGPRRDGTWHETGVLAKFDSPQIPIVWRAEVGAGYSGPTVADGRVLLTDRVAEPAQQERVLCFDEKTGQSLWTHAYPCEYTGIGYKAGPRAAVTVVGDRALALGAMGHLHCLDTRDGRVLWNRDLNRDYQIQEPGSPDNRMPIWGISAAPLVYDDLVILHIGGREGACVVALRIADGGEVWRALNDRAQYAAPIVIQQAGQDVVVVWTGDSVAGLGPRTGEVHWRFAFRPIKMPIGIATPIVQDRRLFVTSFYDGSLMLSLDPDKLAVEELWSARGRSEMDTEALQSIISTPIWLGDYLYGVDSYGELRCLRADTGERVWEDLTATPKARWSTIHFVQNGDDTWMFNERGELLIGRLAPEGFREISRAQLIAPTLEQLRMRDGVCWSHPAFANRHVFARNDQELVCGDLRKQGDRE